MELICQRKTGTTNSGTAAYVKTDRVPPGESWVLDFASLYNQSGEAVTLRWAILRGSTVILVSADAAVADGAAVATNVLPVLMEGEQFAAQVTGTAKASTVTLVFSAHALPPPSPADQGE